MKKWYKIELTAYELAAPVLLLLLVLGTLNVPSCKDVCKECKSNPSLPGCAEVISSGRCNEPSPTPSPIPVPTTTTTSTTSTTTTTTTLPPTPAPAFCFKLTGPHTCTENVSNTPGVFQDKVNKALALVTGCSIGSSCRVEQWQKAIIDLMEKLNFQDFCTSFDIQGGNNGLGSELGVRSGVSFTEYYQPITANKMARWASPRSICTPAFDEEQIDEVKEAWKGVDNSGSCPVKAEGDYFVDLIVGKIGPNPQQYSATPKYCGSPVRKDVFPNCGTKCCILGVDGANPNNQNAIFCEKELSGEPQWFGSDTLTIIPAFDGNPYNVKVTGGHGKLKACGKGGCSNEIVF